MLGGHAVQTSQIEEEKRLVLLPLIVNWITTNRQLSDTEMNAFIRQNLGHFDNPHNLPLDNMMAMAMKFKDHPSYKKHIEVVLSKEGQEWLKRFMKRSEELKSKQRRSLLSTLLAAEPEKRK